MNVTSEFMPIVTALLGVFSAFGVLFAGAFITWLSKLSIRLRRMETRDRLSWLYIRSLIHWAHTHGDVQKNPLPEPPNGLFEPEQY